MNTEQFTSGPCSPRLSRVLGFLVAAMAATGMAACGGASDGGNGSGPKYVDLTVHLQDVNGGPIAGAGVSVTAGSTLRQATSDANGEALFPRLPRGEVTLSAVAADFNAVNESRPLNGASQRWSVLMYATREWAVGRPIVLGTRAVDVAGNGSVMTFALDIAVIGEDSQALEILTAADFTPHLIDCGWGGPRDCASDAAGNASGNGGHFSIESGAEAFEFRPGAARHPWLAAVLVERSSSVHYWGEQGPAMKTFFQGLGGNDLASLFTVQLDGAVTTLTQLGPFTSDGNIYLDAIDRFAAPAGAQPAVLDGLLETIRRAAAVADVSVPGTEATVLVVARPDLPVNDIRTVATLANQLGVHISTIAPNTYGVPEMAVRTGGFAADFWDPRQLSMIYGALENVLGGSMPYYRMQFRIAGAANTFVSGGNVKVNMRVRVPSDIPSYGISVTFDVAVP